YFLDRVANRIGELDDGALYRYTGDYSVFLEQKAERMEQLASMGRKRERLYQQELAWMRKGAKARTTKQKARIGRFEALAADVGAERGTELDMTLSATRLGKKVLEARDLAFGYGEDRTVIRSFDAIIQREDRIGIVGLNG